MHARRNCAVSATITPWKGESLPLGENVSQIDLTIILRVSVSNDDINKCNDNNKTIITSLVLIELWISSYSCMLITNENIYLCFQFSLKKESQWYCLVPSATFYLIVLLLYCSFFAYRITILIYFTLQVNLQMDQSLIL